MIIENKKRTGDIFSLEKNWGEKGISGGRCFTLTGDLGVGENCVYAGLCGRSWNYRAG